MPAVVPGHFRVLLSLVPTFEQASGNPSKQTREWSKTCLFISSLLLLWLLFLCPSYISKLTAKSKKTPCFPKMRKPHFSEPSLNVILTYFGVCLPNMHPYFSILSFLEQWAHTVNTNFYRNVKLGIPFMGTPKSFSVMLTAYFNKGTLRHPLTSQCSTGRGSRGMLLVWWAVRLVLGHPKFHRERSPDLGQEKRNHLICTCLPSPHLAPVGFTVHATQVSLASY